MDLLRRITGRGGEQAEEAVDVAAVAETKSAEEPTLPVVKLLVIDVNKDHDWAAIFKGSTVKLAKKPAKQQRQNKTSRAHVDEPTAVASADDVDVGDVGAAAGAGAGAGTGAGSGAGAATEPDGAAEPDTAEDTLVEHAVQVFQAGWDDISMTSYSNSGCMCTVRLKKAKEFNGLDKCVMIKPDSVLVRNIAWGLPPRQDYRRLLYGFKFGLVPCMNSIDSMLMMLERPVAFARLLEIQREVGDDAFPLIEQTYYPDAKEMVITPDYPIVVKVAHVHAGYGKMVLQDHHSLTDLASVIATTSHYCTAEHFVEGSYDIRVQKIGSHYRAFKRFSVSGDWKTNTGTSMMEELEVSPRFKLWADKCAESWGGMDIVTVDAIRDADGNEFILEMNGTASGLGGGVYTDTDNGYIRDLVLERMAQQVFAS